MKWLADIIWQGLSGIIVPFSGSIENIPEGWHICDGTEGTPDLRNRFIVGAGDEYSPGQTGGSTTHLHNYTSPPHSHSFVGGAGIAAGNNFDEHTSEEGLSGQTTAALSTPPFYALAFIMRL